MPADFGERRCKSHQPMRAKCCQATPTHQIRTGMANGLLRSVNENGSSTFINQDQRKGSLENFFFKECCLFEDRFNLHPWVHGFQFQTAFLLSRYIMFDTQIKFHTILHLNRQTVTWLCVFVRGQSDCVCWFNSDGCGAQSARIKETRYKQRVHALNCRKDNVQNVRFRHMVVL